MKIKKVIGREILVKPEARVVVNVQQNITNCYKLKKI
jgi:hypothetical protein